MDIQNIASGLQSSEQYKIRKQTEAQQAEQIQEQQELAQLQQQTDEYDKNNPVGESVEGIYSVSHDDDGILKVDYKQPAQKSEAKSENDDAKNLQDAKASGQAEAGAGAEATTSTASTEDDDDELEELKKQRDILKQQLNRETDEATKAQLRTQLQSIEMQIALKSSNV